MNKSVAVGVLLFVAGIGVGRVSVLMNQPQPVTATPPSPLVAAPAATSQPGGVLRGKIAEVIQVSQYTYLRLESGEWAAVPSAQLAAGQSVGISLQNEMVDFTSPSLGRTFARIWFGALEGAAPPAPSPSPMQAQPTSPPEVKAALEAVGASSALQLRVVDVFSERRVLEGQRVKVKGTVDRVNFVQGIHYVHLKDGTGVAGEKTDDLLCLSQAEMAKGAQVTIEGLVVLEKDVGMGPVPVALDQAVAR